MILTAAIVIGVSALFTNVIETNRLKTDRLLNYVDLKPFSRRDLSNYTTFIGKDTTNKYVDETVGNIYAGVINAAAEGLKGFHHDFKPLKPVDYYPIHSYMPHITGRLNELFPGCDVEYNHRLNVIGVYWYREVPN